MFCTHVDVYGEGKDAFGDAGEALVLAVVGDDVGAAKEVVVLCAGVGRGGEGVELGERG